jgi:hypothetical protein
MVTASSGAACSICPQEPLPIPDQLKLPNSPAPLADTTVVIEHQPMSFGLSLPLKSALGLAGSGCGLAAYPLIITLALRHLRMLRLGGELSPRFRAK